MNRVTTILNRSTVATAAFLLAVLGPLLVGAAAVADGPGYGGTADRLAVRWDETPRPQAAAADGPAQATALVVHGLGFRGSSAVEVQVGDNGVVRSRTDDVGAVTLSVPVDGAAGAPGTSVFAVGRATSGTSRTLVGAVPPRPSGPGPMDHLTRGALVLLAVVVVGRGGRAVLARAQRGSKR